MVRRGGPILLTVVLLPLWGCGDEAMDPLIETILPSQGTPGTLVDVVGERFEGERQQVHFGGIVAHVELWQERRVRARVPAGLSGHTLVVVTVDGRPSNAVGFFVEGGATSDGGP